MPTPSERLQKIIDSQQPSEVIWKAQQTASTDQVALYPVKTKEACTVEIPEDKELQTALAKEVQEHFDQENGKYFINSTVDALWSSIKRTIRREYDEVSTRCNATRKKTDQFIRDILITDKHLPNYLIQVFIKVRSPSYQTLSTFERQQLFEQFESLRRTYGKRS